MRTETVDQRFVDIDQWPTELAVEAMLEGQLAAVAALQTQTAAIAHAADAAAERLKEGGSLVYAGAGTSGRIAVQDGAELHPTFDWPRNRLIFLMAGGMEALIESREGAEDDAGAARRGVSDHAIGATDVVIGVAASGRTPFTLAVLEAARSAGALTIAIANNPGSALLALGDHAILADTGSEIVAGSTRMKAGTAQKAVLNLLSTAIMLRLGRVYRGLMVDMRVSNDKLAARARAMVANLADVDHDTAATALLSSGNNIKAAVLISLGASPDEARRLLAADDLRAAIERWRGPEMRHAR